MSIARLFIILAALVVSAAAHAESPLTVVESKFSVKETADRLEAVLSAKGLKLAARIDHATAATTTGLEMPPTEVLMFGNPKLGTPLMLANPEIAIELPMKIVIWQAADGKVKLAYTDPEALKQRYTISGQDETFKAMTGALTAFTKAAAGQE